MNVREVAVGLLQTPSNKGEREWYIIEGDRSRTHLNRIVRCTCKCHKGSNKSNSSSPAHTAGKKKRKQLEIHVL